MERNNLEEKLVDLSKNIPKKQWRYFHRESIRNFIINIDSIKGKTEKKNTAEIINNCLNDIELNFEPNIDYSIYLFNNYIRHITSTFQNRLGFWPIPSKRIWFFLILAIFLIFIILIKYKILTIVFSVIILTIACILTIRFRMHKVYGFGF